MGKGLLRTKGLEGLRLKGHDRDDDDVIHKGHDTFKGNGYGHSEGTKGSDGTGTGGTGTGGTGTGGTGTGGSGPGTGGDCHDYVCGGTLPCIEVEEGDTFVFDIDSPFRSSGDGNTLYAIVGGDDADLFEVNATTGELSFKDGAVFDNAPDADNEYEVTVRATDLFNPCRPKDVKLCVEVTEDDVTSGGPLLLDVDTSFANRSQSKVGVVTGSSFDIADYSIVGPNAEVLELVAADDLSTPDTFEIDIVVLEGFRNTAGTIDRDVPPDSRDLVDFYDFEVLLTVDGVTAESGLVSAALVQAG